MSGKSTYITDYTCFIKKQFFAPELMVSVVISEETLSSLDGKDAVSWSLCTSFYVHVLRRKETFQIIVNYVTFNDKH
jgi:hypothetical protein